MRREIPDDAGVGLMESEVDAAYRNEVDIPQLSRVDQLFDPHHRRAVQERCGPASSTSPARSARSTRSATAADDEARGFSTQTCLPASRAAAAMRVMRRDRRRDDDGVELGIGEQVVEFRGVARARMARRSCRERAWVLVAEPRELCPRAVREVPHEVRSPMPKPHHTDAEEAARGQRHAVPRVRNTTNGVRSKSLKSSPSDQSRA